jgi:hypothetical protein
MRATKLKMHKDQVQQAYHLLARAYNFLISYEPLQVYIARLPTVCPRIRRWYTQRVRFTTLQASWK